MQVLYNNSLRLSQTINNIHNHHPRPFSLNSSIINNNNNMMTAGSDRVLLSNKHDVIEKLKALVIS